MLYNIAHLEVGLKYIASNNILTSISRLESRSNIPYQTLAVNDELNGGFSCASWFLHDVWSGCWYLTVPRFCLKGSPTSLLQRSPWKLPGPGSRGIEIRSVTFVFSPILPDYHHTSGRGGRLIPPIYVVMEKVEFSSHWAFLLERSVGSSEHIVIRHCCCCCTLAPFRYMWPSLWSLPRKAQQSSPVTRCLSKEGNPEAGLGWQPLLQKT